MALRVPWPRVFALGVTVLVLGVVTAGLATRHAASRAAVLAVKEDW